MNKLLKKMTLIKEINQKKVIIVLFDIKNYNLYSLNLLQIVYKLMFAIS